MPRMPRILATLALTVLFAHALVASDQVRRRSGPALVPMEVALKAGADAFNAKGEGACTHAPTASIYNVLSEMRSVRHEDGNRSVQLTLWKPADGSAQMFTLSVNGAKSLTISTVRGGEISGSGTVTFAPSGKGGTFTIAAKSKTGETVSGTVRCDAFTPAQAEGG